MLNNSLFSGQNASEKRALAQRLVNLVAHGYEPRDVEREMFLFELRQIERHHPRLIHLVRACAFAPYVNPEIIGA
ncbi:MAG: hypothetical protein AAF126_09555, partial [Chloroflexota bacterium]